MAPINIINNMCDECTAYILEFNALFNPEPFYFWHHKIKDCKQRSINKYNIELSCVRAYADDLYYFTKNSFKDNNIEKE